MNNPNEKIELQVQGIKWLYDMEMVDSPQLINNLKLNIYSLSKKIKDLELLVLQEHKSMVVYYKIGVFSRLFTKYPVLNEMVLDRVNQLLPNFRIRVVNDYKLFMFILKRAKEYSRGEKLSNFDTFNDGSTSNKSRKPNTVEKSSKNH